ncbi:MAG TPA: DUF2272 domain-containing protein, partial [Marinobacter sp.]|nr:DUF2272 domain-containing protein [Marinobacter sp.]
FISYVMRQAGTRNSDGFVVSIRHMTYIVNALLNRKNRDLDRPFWLYDAAQISPNVGDILCKPWHETPCESISLTSLESQYIEESPSGEFILKGRPSGHSHTDIVVKRFSDEGIEYIEALGGNTGDLTGVAHTVGRKRWRLDANGRVDSRVDSDNQPIDDCLPFAYIRIVHPSLDQFLEAASSQGGTLV